MHNSDKAHGPQKYKLLLIVKYLNSLKTFAKFCNYFS